MKQREHKVWVDCLRMLAMFLVVMSHCCDPFTANPDPAVSLNPELGFWGGIWQSCTRVSVPLFVCMTGLLLLPVRRPMGEFWGKRISRVFWPFLIWSILYNLFPVVAGACGLSIADISRCFPAVENPTDSLSSALLHIARIPFDFSPYTLHMWYVFLIIGLYLFLPIFSAWVSQATQKEKYCVLALWTVTLFLPVAEKFSNHLFGTCEWNSFGMLYYFAGFSGYLLLGHMVAESKPMSWCRTLALSLPLLFAGYLITFFGYRIVQTGAVSSCSSFAEMLAAASNPGVAGTAYEESHELMLLYCSPNVAMMTLALLLIFRHFNRVPQRVGALLANMTACGFGIYMTHYFFVGPVSICLQEVGVPLNLQIPIAALFAFPLAWLFVAVLRNLIPGKWLMG